MAKRVNVRFLTILTAVVVPAAILVVASPWIYSHLLHHNPKHWIALGDAAAAQGRWQEAVNDYGSSLQLDGTNKVACVALGDAWYHLTAADEQNLNKARASWNRALENRSAICAGDATAARHVSRARRALSHQAGTVRANPGNRAPPVTGRPLRRPGQGRRRYRDH